MRFESEISLEPKLFGSCPTFRRLRIRIEPKWRGTWWRPWTLRRVHRVNYHLEYSHRSPSKSPDRMEFLSQLGRAELQRLVDHLCEAETEAKALNAQTQPITVSVNDKGQVFLQETEIPLNEVVAKLEAIATTGYEERIYVRGERNADYGTVMKVMARISSAGFKNLGLVTLQEQDG